MAYDLLRKQDRLRAHKECLKILYLAAKESESGVNEALKWLVEPEQPITAAAVQEHLGSGLAPSAIAAVSVNEINPGMDDILLHHARWAG